MQKQTVIESNNKDKKLGFPKEVKDKILVDTARHCCVCHRFKGVKVEVHHIEQEAFGGANTYENAISLCFDCHCDAGHYNPKHPKGTKYSPSELRLAKEAWINIVRTDNIKESKDPDAFLCKYFVCENYELLVNIVEGDLSCFPVKKPLLVNSDALQHLAKIVKNHPESYRHANAWGESYKDKTEYLEKYPDVLNGDDIENKQSYFDLLRIPTKDELINLSDKDGVLKLMLKEDLPIKDVTAVVACYENGCGEVKFQEEYIFRKLWCAFLSITNISDIPLALDAVNAYQSNNRGFAPFTIQSDSIQKITLPKVSLEPGESAILTVAVLLPPIYPLEIEEWSSINTEDLGEQVTVVTHAGILSETHKNFYTYGGYKSPISLLYISRGNVYTQEIHNFDFTNMYRIDRHWQCGSCPHLFFINNEIKYQRELLAHCENFLGEDQFTVPAGIDSIIIAEIEDETTVINSIYLNNQLYLSNLVLNKNEYIEIPVNENTKIQVSGFYTPKTLSRESVPQGIKRNELIHQFMFNRSNWPLKKLYSTPLNAPLHR